MKCWWKALRAPSMPTGKNAVRAAEGMSQGINDVMNGLAEEMTTALPTDFRVNGTVNRNDTVAAAGFGGGALVTIQQMIVRSEEDIRRISQELYNLIQSGFPRPGTVYDSLKEV